jgi:hypothetical protein
MGQRRESPEMLGFLKGPEMGPVWAALSGASDVFPEA